ncbi:DNA-binding transcriptional regulator, LysR family [Lachnospiraceae bacterium XBB1006]|nr:DNA-binding transcriptional regulator, LysR family [Lachnospiraceae bacterium XBB1006]
MDNLVKYKLFSITAQTGNISKTAEMTGYTQSGVSHTLKRLEEEVNMQLFIRDRYGVRLTPVGKEFLRYVNSLLSEEEKLRQFVYDTNGIEYGTLTIGTYTSICTHLLPTLLNDFHEDHPGIQIKLREGGIKELENWLNRREVDMIFCSRQDNANYSFHPLKKDAFMAVLPKDYEIEKDTFPIVSFQNTPSILPEAEVDSDIYTLLKEQHVTPQIRYTAKENLTILAMVDKHLGISIIPALALENSPWDIHALPLHPPYARELGIGYLDDESLSPIGKKFLWFVQEYFPCKEE